MGGAVFIALTIGAAGIYDTVSESDGISELHKPVLDWAISLRTPKEFIVSPYEDSFSFRPATP